jgi:hypothetical protein
MTVIFTVLETQMAVAQVRFLLHAAKKNGEDDVETGHVTSTALQKYAMGCA